MKDDNPYKDILVDFESSDGQTRHDKKIFFEAKHTEKKEDKKAVKA